MTEIFDDLPDWRFHIRERSMGFYDVTGRNSLGNLVSRDGLDPDELLAACKEDAKHIEAQIRRAAAVKIV